MRVSLFALTVLIAITSCIAAQSSVAGAKPVVRVGSKIFTEGYILSEIISQKLESAGAKVERRFGLGGTGVVYQALCANQIDVYPEYTGTIKEALLKDNAISSWSGIANRLEKMGLVMSRPLGFNNTYSLAVREDYAKKHNLWTISDLRRDPTARLAFTHEFMRRHDGYPALVRFYHLNFGRPSSMAHSLAYEALANKQIDVTDVYTTDAMIKKLNLVVLKDDKGFFTQYLAVILAREKFVKTHPELWAALTQLEGQIDNQQMIELNAMVDVQKKSFADAARAFFHDKTAPAHFMPPLLQRIAERTRQHVILVAIALLASILVGLPLGVASQRYRKLGQVILVLSGVLQTIPSLALLCFLIPFFGIGTKPAMVALFLYGLLPIVMGTYSGLLSVEPRLLEVGRALGLTPRQSLIYVELPLASRSILAGIQTSTIISIGTATLAALIGAGGYGVPIVTGLAINDTNTILEGAIPAAVLALVVWIGFKIIEPKIIPKGLR